MSTHRTYYIIDRTGREVLSSPYYIHGVTAEGYALVREEENAFSVFNAADESLHSLPKTWGNMALWYRLIGGSLIAYCINSKKGISSQIFVEKYLPGAFGKTIVASCVVNLDGVPLYEPRPYLLHHFDGALGFAEDLEGRGFLINEAGEITHSFPSAWRNYRCLDKSSQRLTNLEFERMDAYMRENKSFAVNLSNDKTYGPFKYIGHLSEGLRIIKNEQDVCFVLNSEWNPLFPFPEGTEKEFDSEFHHGHLAFVSKKNGRTGLLNKQGEVIVKPKSKYITYLGSKYWFYSKGGLHGVMKDNGEIITPANYKVESYSTPALYGLIAVGNKGFRKGYINYDWEWVIPAKYSGCDNFKHPKYAVAFNDL